MMFNFIKVKDNVWLNINNITSIEYYPDGYGGACYLIIYTNGTNEVYSYGDKEEAMEIIQKLRERGVDLDGLFT